MTRVEFYSEGGRITGFCCQGHSGYAEAGADIVCAAVTTAQEARVTLHLPARCDEEETVQAVLAGLMLTLCELRDDYPDYLEVMEVQQHA